MQIISRLMGDQFKAKYGYTKFYLKEIAILLVKAMMVLSASMAFFIIFFMVLTPDATKKTVSPVFQVKKSNQNIMISIFTNNQVKKSFCENETALYYGKLYSKQQYCLFQHENFPFQITNHDQIDVTLMGINKNVEYITSCLVKISEDRSVCQKFAYNQEVKIFNNIIFENLYSIEIQLNLKRPNEFFGETNILFQQENNFLAKLFKQYYLLVSIFASILMSLILTFSFAIFQIPDIIEKGEKQENKIKEA